MRRNDLPHQRLPLEEDVSDVEDGEQPLVIVALEVQVRFHPRDLGVADVGTVEEGEDVERCDEADDAEVHFADDAGFDVRVDVGMGILGWLVVLVGRMFDLGAGGCETDVLFVVFDGVGGCRRGVFCGEEAHGCWLAGWCLA